MVNCPGCGAGMRFDPDSQMVKCDHCETKIPPEQAVPTQEINGQQVFDSALYSCPSCGAEVISDEDTVATFCSFCGASVMLNRSDVKMAAPSYVLPFKKNRTIAETEYKKLVRRSLFAPGYIKDDAQMSKMRGIYIPYWMYDFEREGDIAFKGTRSRRSGDYILTDHYNLVANVEAEYKGLAFDASASFADELSEAIAPFDVRDNKPFSAAYLSGFYADTADVQAATYEQEAKSIAMTDVSEKVYKLPEFRNFSKTPGDVSGGYGMNTKKQEVAYFPVWFMASRNKDKVSYAVINGQSGKVAADLPIHYGKYLLGSLILAAPIIVLLNLFVTLTPQILMIFGIVFSIVCWSIANKQLNLVYTRRWYLNDRGLQSTRGGVPLAAQKQLDKNQRVNSVPKKANPIGGAVALLIYGTIGAAIVCSEMDLSPAIIGIAVIVFTVNIIVQSIIYGAGKKSTMKKVVFKSPMKEKIGTLIKPMIAVAIGVIMMLVNPIEDFKYYIGVIIVMILVLVSFFDLVKLHNQLTLRMPRQFAKRGGDEVDGI